MKFCGNYLYRMFTSPEFRLKRERKTLDKEIEESWTELKKLESLVEKKKELKRKLPEQGSQSLKAPVSEGSVVTHKTVAEVHVADGGTARYVPKPSHKTSQSGRARSPPTSQ